MVLRQPATAILTVTLLAAASATPALAVDCVAFQKQLVSYYNVYLKYQTAVIFAAQRCVQIQDAIKAKLVPDPTLAAQNAQCIAIFNDLKSSQDQAGNAYGLQLANYQTVCTTTATYGKGGGPDAPANPDYPVGTAGMSSPYYGVPAAGQPIPGAPAPAPVPDASAPTADAGAPSPYATGQDVQTILNFFGGPGGVSGGWGGGRSSGGGRTGGGSSRHC